MAEEQRCQTPPEHRLCANNCGFFGSPATLNLCSKCYRDHCLSEQQASSAKIAVEKSLAGSSSSMTTTKVVVSTPALVLPSTSADGTNLVTAAAPSPAEETPPAVDAQPGRCSTCRKKVGLTAIKCKCGMTFCATHRYPEKHECTFDYKALGRNAISKANPVVKADKLEGEDLKANLFVKAESQSIRFEAVNFFLHLGICGLSLNCLCSFIMIWFYNSTDGKENDKQLIGLVG